MIFSLFFTNDHLGKNHTTDRKVVLPEVGWPSIVQAEILREWNQLNVALSLAEESISLYQQTASMSSLVLLLCGYEMLLRICLSRRDYDAACSALRQIEHIGMRINQRVYIDTYSRFTTIDQVRLWLACGELEQATCWAEELDL